MPIPLPLATNSEPNEYPEFTWEPQTMWSFYRSGNISTFPHHTVHIRLHDGSEFTEEDIRQWAEGRLCSIATGKERLVIKSLAQIIVRRVLQ